MFIRIKNRTALALALLVAIGGLLAVGPTASATVGRSSKSTGSQGIFDGTLTPGTKVIRAKDASAYPTPRLLWSRDYDRERGAIVAVDVRSNRAVVQIGPCADCGYWYSDIFEAATGEYVKSSTVPAYAKYAVDDTSFYLQSRHVLTGQTTVVATNLADRTERWWQEYSWTGTITTAGTNGRLYAITDNGDSGFGIRSIDPATGNELWSTTVPKSYVVAEAKVIGSGLYIVQDCGKITRLDAATGATVWSHSPNCSNNAIAVPVAYGGRLYTDARGGTFNVLDSQTGVVIATREWDRMPVIDGRVGYFIRDGVLTAVDLKLSKTLWQLHVTQGVNSVSAKDGLVSVTGGTGVMYLAEMWTGKIRWTLRSSTSALSGIIGSGVVAVPTEDSLSVYAP